MKLWIDGVRSAPIGFVVVKSVDEAKRLIENCELMYKASGKKSYYKIEMIDIDHNAGDYVQDDGDYIKLLDWLEETGRNYPIHIHNMNPVDAENMRKIIQKNNWTEIV